MSEVPVANLLQDPSLADHENVTVIVAGSKFCIVPSLWKKVQSLPWMDDVHGYPQLLHANPDIFELLLQYFLFGSLPGDLSKDLTGDLMELASPLNGVKPLLDHLEASQASQSEADTKSTTSFISKSISTLTNTPKKMLLRKKLSDRQLKYIPDTVYPFAANKDNAILNVDYLPNLEAANSTDSEESSNTGVSSISGDSVSIVSSNMETNKDKKTLVLKRSHGSSSSSMFSSLNFLGKRSTKRKLTHEEWCASDYVL